MAIPQPPPPGLLFVAVFSRFDAALDWAVQRIEQRWGAIAATSPRLVHGETSYYAPDMGTPLYKQLLVVEELTAPSRLPQLKLQSNAWEEELAATGRFSVRRPLNIDPGYLALHKLVLASAKDRAHRIYLSEGIYAEPCLGYRGGRWEPWPWTYPDYRRAEYHQFLNLARRILKQRLGRLAADGCTEPQAEEAS